MHREVLLIWKGFWYSHVTPPHTIVSFLATTTTMTTTGNNNSKQLYLLYAQHCSKHFIYLFMLNMN